MHRAMAFVLRYINNLKQLCHGGNKSSGHLTHAELIQAEIMLIKLTQREECPTEITLLSLNRDRTIAEQITLSKRSALYGLSPFIDDVGLLRMDGRIGAAKNVRTDTKFPVILPRDHLTTNCGCIP